MTNGSKFLVVATVCHVSFVLTPDLGTIVLCMSVATALLVVDWLTYIFIGKLRFAHVKHEGHEYIKENFLEKSKTNGNKTNFCDLIMRT